MMGKGEPFADRQDDRLTRRRFLGCGLLGAACLASAGARAHVPAGSAGRLTLQNPHTGERVEAEYRPGGRCPAETLTAINRLLRDQRSGDVYPIDTGLLDLLYALAGRLDRREPFLVVCGYRSPATNAMLYRMGRGVAKNSFHTVGKAIDIRMSGVPLPELRRAAMELRGGGVGYYPKSNFVHVDVGSVRSW